MDGLEAAWLTLRRELDTALHESARTCKTTFSNDLNAILRRFRSYEGESEWVMILLDAASCFSSELAVFAVRENQLRLLGQRSLALPSELVCEPPTMRAFATAIASKEVAVTLRTEREVGPHLSAAPSGSRACIVPVLNGERVVAVVFAGASPETDIGGLELIAGMASLVLERHSNAIAGLQIQPAKPASDKAAGNTAATERKLPSWIDLTEDQRSIHIRAQRFARVKVAEMQLAHPDAARAGREQNNVYLFLKTDIDAARESYRAQFLSNKSMVDYLHLELVHSIAAGDEEKLGADYPGQLV